MSMSKVEKKSWEGLLTTLCIYTNISFEKKHLLTTLRLVWYSLLTKLFIEIKGIILNRDQARKKTLMFNNALRNTIISIN